ncbi:MAG: VWA domain-containing protein [Selenomonadaceae bacterium]|nr:VWA domain-containing protein [Selenomonadaceae bacterium]
MANISNTSNNTLISGTSESDNIDSRGNYVTIDGGAGSDAIVNLDSLVTIDGGVGSDSIISTDDSITTDGNDDDDWIMQNGDYVTVDGGNGNDVIINSGSYSSVSGGSGDDTILSEGGMIQLTGGFGSVTASFTSLGRYGSMTINGGLGNDQIQMPLYAGNNVIQYTEGDGNDSVYAYSENGSLQINSASPWSSVVSNNDIVITVGDGSITLVDAATSTSGININGTTYPVDMTATVPAVVDTSTIPAIVDTSTIPAVDTSTIPAVVDTSTIPAVVDTSTIPAVVDTSTIPAVVDTSTIPAVVDTSTVVPVNPAAPTDVVFIIDNTGSMGDEIQNVKTAIISFAKNLANSGAGYRLGLVEFGDLGDSAMKVYGFTDRDTFINWVDGITLTSGGDGPESGLEAITAATTMDFMPGSNKRFIVVTDNSFHNLGEDGDGDPSTYFQSEAVQSLLAANAVKMDVVGTPKGTETDNVCQDEYEPLANATGGKFYDINNLAGGEVLEEISDDILGRAHVNINLDTDSVPDGTTSGVFVVTPVLNAVGAVVPASSDATFKTAAEEGDYVVGYVVAEKAYMAVPDSPWRQIVTIPDNWIVSGTWQDDALNITGSNVVVSGSLGKDNISINEDVINTTLVDVTELQNGSDTLSFSKRVVPGTLKQNFVGTGVALYTTNEAGELDFVINLPGITALDESLLNCEVSNAGKPNTIRELIYGEVQEPVAPDVPIINGDFGGRIIFAQWGYGFTPPEGNPLLVNPTLATSADFADNFGSPTLDDIAPANFAVTQDDFTAQNFMTATSMQAKILALAKPKF